MNKKMKKILIITAGIILSTAIIGLWIFSVGQNKTDDDTAKKMVDDIGNEINDAIDDIGDKINKEIYPTYEDDTVSFKYQIGWSIEQKNVANNEYYTTNKYILTDSLNLFEAELIFIDIKTKPVEEPIDGGVSLEKMDCDVYNLSNFESFGNIKDKELFVSKTGGVRIDEGSEAHNCLKYITDKIYEGISYHVYSKTENTLTGEETLTENIYLSDDKNSYMQITYQLQSPENNNAWEHYKNELEKIIESLEVK